jgi:phage terminase small subunit
MKLTPKQQKFCEEYMIDLNGTQAAIRAGYSAKTAVEQSSRLLINVKIANAISELKQKLSAKTGVTAERLINELAKIGFSNIQDYVSGDNLITDISKIPKEQAACIESIKTVTTVEEYGKVKNTRTQVSIKLYSKINSIELMGKHIGLFERDNLQKQIVMPPPIINVRGPKGN